MAANPEFAKSLSPIEFDTEGESFQATYDSSDSASLARDE